MTTNVYFIKRFTVKILFAIDIRVNCQSMATNRVHNNDLIILLLPFFIDSRSACAIVHQYRQHSPATPKVEDDKNIVSGYLAGWQEENP